MGALEGTITNILNLMTGVGLLACAFFLCMAGFYFMTSGGSPAKIDQSRSAAYNAAIGFALVLSARVIANIIRGAVVTG